MKKTTELINVKIQKKSNLIQNIKENYNSTSVSTITGAHISIPERLCYSLVCCVIDSTVTVTTRP